MIGETTTVDLLNRKEVDVFLVIAADPGAHFPGGANMHLAEIPVIQIDIHWGPSTELADIVFPGTFIGVETEGTSYRMDSVPIHMKSAIDPPETCREDEWIVNELLERVKMIKEAK
jgi:formylmethanofuran dehydrogenase subunit B